MYITITLTAGLWDPPQTNGFVSMPFLNPPLSFATLYTCISQLHWQLDCGIHTKRMVLSQCHSWIHPSHSPLFIHVYHYNIVSWIVGSTPNEWFSITAIPGSTIVIHSLYMYIIITLTAGLWDPPWTEWFCLTAISGLGWSRRHRPSVD